MTEIKIARYRSICDVCLEDILEGEEIAKLSGSWIHAKCLPKLKDINRMVIQVK